MTAKAKARIRMGATLVPLLLGLVMIVVGFFGVVGDAGAVTRPAAGQFHIGGTENFPMFSNLVLDFSSLRRLVRGLATPSGVSRPGLFDEIPDKMGLFTGSVNMTHANAVGNNVALTLNSLTQSSGGFTITSVMPSGGMATGTPGFPASSLLTVNYLLSTPFAPPNDQLKGTHTLQANNITCWPPTDIYSGTTPSNILRVSDNAVVGRLTAPYHSQMLPSIPLLSPGYLILFGLILAIVGFALVRRSAT